MAIAVSTAKQRKWVSSRKKILDAPDGEGKISRVVYRLVGFFHLNIDFNAVSADISDGDVDILAGVVEIMRSAAVDAA